MATDLITRHLTARDEEILLALDRCPLTVQQILKLSQTFPGHAFTSPRSVQDRLQKLREAGWVCRWTYATIGRTGAPDYYKLTLLGYRLLYGRDAAPPTKRAFSEVSIGYHHHTLCLADFIVHTLVAAHRARIHMVNFSREHTVQFSLGHDSLFPDCAFELHTPTRCRFNYLVELDNATERVRSDKDVDSWQRKIRLYEQLQDQRHPHRFRVLIVATRSADRLRHILSLAAGHARNPSRSLFYGTLLHDFLAHPAPIHSPCFLDHRLSPTPLIPSPDSAVPARHLSPLEALRRTCYTLALALCLSSDPLLKPSIAWLSSARIAASREYHLLNRMP